MTHGKIIKYLQDMDWLSKHWRVKDFIVVDDDKHNVITFSYYHGDMGLIDKVRYDKESGYTEIYDLDNYYGREVLYHSLYIPNMKGEMI